MLCLFFADSRDSVQKSDASGRASLSAGCARSVSSPGKLPLGSSAPRLVKLGAAAALGVRGQEGDTGGVGVCGAQGCLEAAEPCSSVSSAASSGTGDDAARSRLPEASGLDAELCKVRVRCLVQALTADCQV